MELDEAKDEQQQLASRKAALVFSDESSAGPYITGAVMRLPSLQLDAAAQALSEAKRNVGPSTDTKIHCRVISMGMHGASHRSRT
jgi:hypothetical protein